MSAGADRLEQLRSVLGLTQAQMSAILGVKGKTLTRFEVGGRLKPSMDRLVRVLLRVRLSEVEAELKAILWPPAENSDVEEAARKEAFERAVAEVGTRLDSGARPDARLEDVTSKARPNTWVYWATGARASAVETIELADRFGFICRPLRFNSSEDGKPSRQGRAEAATDYEYLEQVRAGDELLLCHNGEPRAWYRIKRVPAHGAGPPPHGLAQVFRFVEADSPLGHRLGLSDYRLNDGRRWAAETHGFFSGLSVARIDRPLGRPKPRPEGIRWTMTEFTPDGSRT